MDQTLLLNERELKKYNIYSIIPTRVVFVMLGFFGFNLVYAYKVVLSVTLVAMVEITDNVNNTDTGSECTVPSANNSLINSNSTNNYGRHNWNSDEQASILGAFFYGYVLTQIPGALLAQRFDAKKIFGYCLFTAALLSLLSPTVAQWSFEAFFITRFCQGLAEGVVFPCIYKMIAKWLPKMERSLGSTIIFTGSQIGTVLTFPIAGLLSDSDILGGWPAIFYLLGIVGCVWFILWSLLIYESPDKHPYISQSELSFIKRGQKSEVSSNQAVIPWKSILTSVPVYALILTSIGQNWGYLTILTMLPTYFQKILHLDIKKNGFVSGLPYLLQALCGWIAGLVSDRLRKSGRFSINTIRKCNNSIAFFGPAICLIAVVHSKCDAKLSIIFFTLAMGLNGLSFSGFACTHVDMAPDFAAILMGLANSVANLPGFLAPAVANALTKNSQTLENWSHVFYLCSFVFAISGFNYIFFASSKLQSWGISEPMPSDREKINS